MKLIHEVIPLKQLMKFSTVVIVLIVTSGCVNTELMADVDPATDLVSLNTFYVAKNESDDRGIEEIIATELVAMGKKATSGVEAKPTSPVDAVITYEDKWMWDITMYMLELTIDLRDPQTNYKFATGRSYRTSLARKSPSEMVNEVLNEIFNGPSPGDSE